MTVIAHTLPTNIIWSKRPKKTCIFYFTPAWIKPTPVLRSVNRSENNPGFTHQKCAQFLKLDILLKAPLRSQYDITAMVRWISGVPTIRSPWCLMISTDSFVILPPGHFVSEHQGGKWQVVWFHHSWYHANRNSVNFIMKMIRQIRPLYCQFRGFINPRIVSSVWNELE